MNGKYKGLFFLLLKMANGCFDGVLTTAAFIYGVYILLRLLNKMREAPSRELSRLQTWIRAHFGMSIADNKYTIDHYLYIRNWFVDHEDEGNYQKLYNTAAKEGRLDIIQFLDDVHTNIDYESHSAIAMAAAQDNADIVEYMFTSIQDNEAIVLDIFDIAIQRNSLATFRKLVSYTEYIPDNIATLTIKYSRLDMLKLVNDITEEDIRLAALYSSYDMLKYLIHAYPDLKPEYLLASVVSTGQLEKLILLQQHGFKEDNNLIDKAKNEDMIRYLRSNAE